MTPRKKALGLESSQGGARSPQGGASQFCCCFLNTLTLCGSEIPGARGDLRILLLPFSGLLRLERENMPADPQQSCVHLLSSALVESHKGEH